MQGDGLYNIISVLDKEILTEISKYIIIEAEKEDVQLSM